VRRNDDELAEAVTRALRADSYTTDLAIEVEVEDGVVYLRGQVTSLEDIEQAEEVAGRVPGVEDVEEELEIV
jgi:osmotically-inducible protein OsmY